MPSVTLSLSLSLRRCTVVLIHVLRNKPDSLAISSMAGKMRVNCMHLRLTNNILIVWLIPFFAVFKNLNTRPILGAIKFKKISYYYCFVPVFFKNLKRFRYLQNGIMACLNVKPF